LHPAIIDRETWEAVQAQLQVNGHEHRTKVNARDPSLLAGLLFDEHGRRFTATHAVKNGKRYRYYIAEGAFPGGSACKDVSNAPIRLPAAEIESVVIRQVAGFLADENKLADCLAGELTPDLLARAKERGRRWANDLIAGRSSATETSLNQLVGRIVLGETSLRIEIKPQPLLARLVVNPAAARSLPSEAIALTVPCRIKRRGVETRIVIDGPGGREKQRAPDTALVKAVARGFTWFEDLTTGRESSIAAIAKQEGLTGRYVARLLEMALLPASTIDQILRGEQPAELLAEHLTREPHG
jgi:hypothetical protein